LLKTAGKRYGAMTAIGDVAKGFLLCFIFFYVLAMIGNAVSGNTALALFMFVGLVIPLAWLVYEYAKAKRKTPAKP
jgi:membrane protein implicated in regulation of membrane protease activity